MALREIRKDGDDILRKKSKPVNGIDQKVIQLLDDMVETMKSVDGVGLAAPQVGVLRRVVVIDHEEKRYELINPEITMTEGEQEKTEACLSVPNTRGYVKRPEKATVKAMNRAGEEVTINGEGVLAIALCHEIDHLDGALFIDKVTQYVDPDSDE